MRTDAQLALVLAGTIASYGVGWAVGVPWLLPFLNTLPAWPVLVAALRRGAVGRALALMLAWAAALGVAATALSWVNPSGTARLFLNGDAYRREMFEWLLTGRGAESDPGRFLPQHAAQAAIFCGLSLATGSALSMPMGAALMNDMGHYAGALAARAGSPLLTALLAWHPWAIVRVVSFVTLGAVLAQPVATGRARFPPPSRRLLILAACGLAADAALKWALAPAWRTLLLRMAGW